MARWSKENPAPYMPNKEGKNGSARAKLQRKYLDAYLAPKEMQLDVFMSSTSDAEIDAMIEVLREKVLEAQADPPMKLIEQKAKANA